MTNSDKNDIQFSEVENFRMPALNFTDINVLAIILLDINMIGRPVKFLSIVEIDDIILGCQILHKHSFLIFHLIIRGIVAV